MTEHYWEINPIKAWCMSHPQIQRVVLTSLNTISGLPIEQQRAIALPYWVKLAYVQKSWSVVQWKS